MTFSDGVMVLAVFVAPVFAVQVQKLIEQFQETRKRQLHIFKTLMASRATGLSLDHVQALNLIDLECKGKRFKKTREAWKSYLDHLGDYPKGEQNEVQLHVWNEKKATLLAELLMEMGKPLGYDFDAVHVKKGIYLPEGHMKIENEQALIRQGLLRLLFGDTNIKMDIVSFPVDNGALEKQKKLTHELLKAFESNAGIPVMIQRSND